MSEERVPRLPSTRADLMMLVEASWSAVWEAIDGLDDHQVTQLSLDGGWSINDHIAHLAIWTNSASAILRRASCAESMALPPGVWESGDEALINDAIARQWRIRTASDVTQRLQGAQDELRSVISGMTDDDLARPYASFQPGESSDADEPVIRWIMGTTYEHIDLHLPAIRRLRSMHT